MVTGCETITIVFTDLVGSTEMTIRLGDGAADSVRRVHFGGLESAVRATGGEIIKNLGDGLMIVYRAASEAVAGAVALQQAVVRHSRQAGEPLAMKIGISLGDATFEKGDWFGTPVIEAARLCAAASAGQILVSDLVRLVAGSRSDFAMVAAGAHDLKGLPEPLVCSEVIWSPALTAADLGLPSGLVPPPSALVGRAAEMALATQRWAEVRSGQRRAVLLAGEAGIGKTRLSAELSSIAAEDGAVVVLGRCVEDLGVPFLPWREMARAIVERFGAAAVTEWVGVNSGSLAISVGHAPTGVAGRPGSGGQ